MNFVSENASFLNNVIKKNFTKMYRLPLYRFFLFLCGLPVFIVVCFDYLFRGGKTDQKYEKERTARSLRESGLYARIEAEVSAQLQKKYSFLNKNPSEKKAVAECKRITEKRFEEQVMAELVRNDPAASSRVSLASHFTGLLNKPAFCVFSVILGFPLFVLILMYSNPYVKYISERLVMMVFVIFGVTFLVFTILYMSPMDTATNILGLHATPETVAEFNRVYGLDRSYVEQLAGAFKGIITFDMGKSFVGNEDVIPSVMRRFPITLIVTFWSLILSVSVAIPAGIFSAIKPYSAFDYVFMFIVLLGLSLPNFWLGLIFILNFSINFKLLPSLYLIGNWKSLIMPIIVLGTGLAASVARMTRSSMLEVVKQDYVVTAKAKGLPYYKVVLRHVLGNAMIPIVTVIGLQFGAMLGGAAVTEKVFNISGLGSFIVDRQYIPDIPIVLAGTVYVAIVVSIMNLAVDILYAFLDPRIKSKMRSY
jgi:peptide/nickel transport system permease protein